MTSPPPPPRRPDDEQNDAAASLRKYRLALALASLILLSIIAGGLLWLRYRNQISDSLFAGTAGAATLVVMAATLLRYLGDDYRDATLRVMRLLAGPSVSALAESGTRGLTRISEGDLRYLLRRLQHAESKARPAVRLTDEDRAAVISAVTESARTEFGHQLLETIEGKYGAAVAKSNQLLELRSLADRTRERLLDEVAALSRRSNLNLVIGIVTTAAAVGLLAFVVMTSPLQVPDWHVLIPSYVLRLSLVVFVEIFAFFFLRMYRVNLQEIKYFQNELTSIEAKLIALEAALRSSDVEGVRSMTALLGNVERNVLLQQGQSTVELERLRLENGTLKGVLELVGKVVPSKGYPEQK